MYIRSYQYVSSVCVRLYLCDVPYPLRTSRIPPWKIIIQAFLARRNTRHRRTLNPADGGELVDDDIPISLAILSETIMCQLYILPKDHLLLGGITSAHSKTTNTDTVSHLDDLSSRLTRII